MSTNGFPIVQEKDQFIEMPYYSIKLSEAITVVLCLISMQIQLQYLKRQNIYSLNMSSSLKNVTLMLSSVKNDSSFGL